MGIPPALQHGGSPPPTEEWPRLTADQRRHLGITLGLLQQQLREVGIALTLPAPRDLPRREGSRLRRIRTVLGILASDLEDARAEKLQGYGTVDPALAGVLDPGIAELQQELRSLEDLLQSRGDQGR
jgi:hypothetical protein